MVWWSVPLGGTVLRPAFFSVGRFVYATWNTWILPSHTLHITLPALIQNHWNIFDSCSLISTNDGGDGLPVSTVTAFETNAGQVSWYNEWLCPTTYSLIALANPMGRYAYTKHPYCIPQNAFIHWDSITLNYIWGMNHFSVSGLYLITTNLASCTLHCQRPPRMIYRLPESVGYGSHDGAQYLCRDGGVHICWNSTQRIYPFVPTAPNRGTAGLVSPTGQSTDRVLTRGRWVAEAPTKLNTHYHN